MTVEFSLRLRAKRARYMAAAWLILATLILMGTYISLPIVANRSAKGLNAMETEALGVDASTKLAGAGKSGHLELYVVGISALGVVTVCFACFLLGRAAFVEIELAARFLAFADALCLAGEDLGQLERIANLLLPGTKYLSVPEIFSVKDLSSVVDIAKELRAK
jgi:hypothetical protein